MEYVGNIVYDDKLQENRKYVIYGYGQQGKKIYKYLENKGMAKNIVAICDRNYKKMNGGLVEIIDPNKAILIENVDFLVSGKYEYEMVEYLLESNISDIHILTL